MPRVNFFGQVLSGNTGAVAVDGDIIAPRGKSAMWWSDNVAGYRVERDGVWSLELQDVRTRQPIPLAAQSGNELALRKGCWAAWLAGTGLFGSVGNYPAGGLNPTGTDERGAVGDDGTLALQADRHNGTATELVPPGKTLGSKGNLVIAPSPYGLCVISATQAIWNGGCVGIVPPKLLGGAINPQYVFDPYGQGWVVYWTDLIGLVAQPEGDPTKGYILSRTNAFHHHAILGEKDRLLVCWSTGVGEFPHESRLIDVWSQEVVDLTKYIFIPPVNKAAWMGWFEFRAPYLPAPHNCTLPTSDLIVVNPQGQQVAQYVAAELQGNTPAAYEEIVAAARLAHPTVPVIPYVTWAVQLTGYVPPGDWIGIEAYWRLSESEEVFEQRIRWYAAKCKRVMLIGQCYTSNKTQTENLVALVPIYARLLRDLPNCVGLLPFSNTGRATGLNDHQEVKPYYQRLFDTILGPPAIEHIQPPDPVDPGPIDPGPIDPIDPEEPEEEMISDDQLREMCDKVATVLGSNIPGVNPPKAFVPNVPHQELWQGCLQMGDKFRKPKSQGGLYERNASATELAMGSYMRDGSTHLDDVKVGALHELLAPIDQEYLRR